jgi:HD-GYP domain-containing protein (c-di-GMP phosphodiesterase class II)
MSQREREASIVPESGIGSEESRQRRVLDEGIAELSAGLRSAGFYGLNHAVTRQHLEQATKNLAMATAKGPCLLHVAADHLVYDRFPICSGSAAAAVMAEEFRAREIGEVVLEPGLSLSEVDELVATLLMDVEALQLLGGAQQALTRQGVGHIKVDLPRPEEDHEQHREALAIYQDAIDTIKRAMSAVQEGAQVDSIAVREVVEEMLSSVLYDRSALLSLAAIKSWDEYLYEHSVGVCIVSMVFACTLKMGEAQILDLGMAAILHDIGKVFVPLDIVRKPGPLTEDEWSVMQTHPVIGARILGTTPGIPEVCAVAAFEHHLKYNYSGYPRVSSWLPLHMYSHILTIVDCYDGLTTVRPYRAPIRPDQAAGWMQYVAPEQFEPHLLARFGSMVRVPPIGAVVRLNTREWAIVMSASERDFSRPVVRLIVDEEGGTVLRTKMVDLSERASHGGFTRSIAECLQPAHQVAVVASTLTR